MDEIRERIASVIRDHPTLTAFGFGAFNQEYLSPEEAQRRTKEGQEELYERAEEVAFVVGWLSAVEKTKRINRRCRSYALKHDAEKTSPKGHVSNGAFIAAALIAGFNTQRSDANAFFNMSLRSLKKKAEREKLEQ